MYRTKLEFTQCIFCFYIIFQYNIPYGKDRQSLY